MQIPKSTLLLADSFINLAFGVFLLFLPGTTIVFFGLPETNTLFYVSVLGAVLLGIGIALFLETLDRPQLRGLGLAGAIAINFLGAGAVAVWLLIDPFHMPTRGYIVLWSVVALVIGIGAIELFGEIRHRHRNEDP